jgi:hypothetical protein
MAPEQELKEKSPQRAAGCAIFDALHLNARNVTRLPAFDLVHCF